MGPRPRGRGTIRSSTARTHVRTWLQWGRDRAVAELVQPRMRVAARTWLQWGRDRAVAELPCADDDTLAVLLGFNGAATARSRNFRKSPAVCWPGFASMGPRPRGRGTRRAAVRKRTASQASMGPRPRGRGTIVYDHRPAYKRLLQWGRDRAVAELSAHGRRRPLRGIGFNGAATARSRN